MLSTAKLRAIPYLRIREGCVVIKESIPLNGLAQTKSINAQYDSIHKELENYFTTRELNRFSNLLYKAAVFQRKLCSHDVQSHLLQSNRQLLLCLKRLSLLKFDNLPEQASSPGPIVLQVDSIERVSKSMKPLALGRKPPCLPKLKDATAVFMHPTISRSLAPAFVLDKQQSQSLSKENQRLEFYGDSVLGELVARSALKRFPNASDGLLTGIKSLLVQNSTLMIYAHVVGLPRLLKEYTTQDLSNNKALADCFESYIGQSKVENGQTLQLMTDCLEALIEPIYDRIEANFECHFGCSEVKVDDVLSEWFELEEEAVIALKGLRPKKIVDTERSAVIANDVERMKLFAKINPSLPKADLCPQGKKVRVHSKANPNRFADFKNKRRLVPNLPKIQKRCYAEEEYPTNLVKAIEVFDTISRKINGSHKKVTYRQVEQANALLMRNSNRKQSPIMVAPGVFHPAPKFQLFKRKKQVISRIFIADGMISEGRAGSLKRSKKMAIQNFWTLYASMYVKADTARR